MKENRNLEFKEDITNLYKSKLIKETIDTNVLKTLHPYSDKNGITKPEFEVYDNQIKVILPKNLYM